MDASVFVIESIVDGNEEMREFDTSSEVEIIAFYDHRSARTEKQDPSVNVSLSISASRF
jgi:hypothetical protein